MIGSICIQYEVCMLNSLGSYCCLYVPKCTDILIAAVIIICIRNILSQNVDFIISGTVCNNWVV